MQPTQDIHCTKDKIHDICKPPLLHEPELLKSIVNTSVYTLIRVLGTVTNLSTSRVRFLHSRSRRFRLQAFSFSSTEFMAGFGVSRMNMIERRKFSNMEA